MATWAAVLPHQWIGTEFLSASRNFTVLVENACLNCSPAFSAVMNVRYSVFATPSTSTT
jgi:hypothetical protein